MGPTACHLGEAKTSDLIQQHRGQSVFSTDVPVGELVVPLIPGPSFKDAVTPHLGPPGVHGGGLGLSHLYPSVDEHVISQV
jgi:hypothetical protein